MTQFDKVQAFGITFNFAPVALAGYALTFLDAAMKTVPEYAHVPGLSPVAPVRTFLVCRALELTLKAALSVKGYGLETLKSGPFGHDLANLVEQAEKHELIKLQEDHRTEILKASAYYAGKIFEYPALLESLKGFPDSPNTDVLMAAAHALFRAVAMPAIAVSQASTSKSPLDAG